ncbi:MAG: prolyl oligopeptidase family serine peptidase [Kiritimatiellae bacterium]|nr:prolyl oligopeptidase family serine peptidase [Kiritimatiellia bacterium]
MRKTIALVALLASSAALADGGWASRSLGIEPERFAGGRAGRRALDWYRHAADPAWGGTTDATDRFSVAHPVDGPAAGRPLLVVLHWRGAGWPGKGVDMQTALADEKGSVFSAPDGFFILTLDDIRNYHVLFNRTHDDYWWGATPSYAGPTREDVPRLLNRATPCERRVMDCVEWTIRRYAIDRARVYLCGNSMGGQAAYAIGLAHGDVFAAINANVPATVWYAAARLGFVDAEGRDELDWSVAGLADPPVCVEWSGVDDVWSRERDVIVRNLVRRKWPHIILWGDFGHCGSVEAARRRNDLVERFDWLSVRLDEAYPVFTSASCDDRLPWPFKVWRPRRRSFSGWRGDIYEADMQIADGAPTSGQVNAFFRWRVVRDDAEGFGMELRIASADELGTRQFTPPESAIADVTVRRIQTPELARARRVAWEFGGASGIAERDAHGALTIRDLGIMRKPQILRLCPAAASTP